MKWNTNIMFGSVSSTSVADAILMGHISSDHTSGKWGDGTCHLTMTMIMILVAGGNPQYNDSVQYFHQRRYCQAQVHITGHIVIHDQWQYVRDV